MTSQEYIARLQSYFPRVHEIVDSVGLKLELDKIGNRLVSIHEQEEDEQNSLEQLDQLKADFLSLLNETLTKTQIAFVELEEPDDSDTQLFKDYYEKLKTYKQELLSNDSETRKKISSLLRHSKTNLLNELSSQAILFPTECLDTILSCPEVEQDNGADWVVQQINEALNSLLSEVDTRLGATFDSVNKIIGSEIESLESSYTQSINLSRSVSSSMSDNMLSVARQALPSLGIGSLGYGIAALALGPIAGVVAGLAAGGLFLWKSQSTMAKQKKISEIKQQLAPKISLAMNELKTYVVERYDEFDENLNESIKSMIDIINVEIQDCIDALKSCENETNEFDTTQIQMNNKMNALEAYIKQLELLNTNPFETKQ